MKILQLTKKFPFPLKDGESVAVHYLSKALSQLGFSITLLSMNTSKHFFNIDDLPDNYNHYERIETEYVDNRVKIIPALINLFSRKSYHISRFENRRFRKNLISLLNSNQYDLILLETLYLTPYVKTIRKNCDAEIIMRSHNLEYEIWERMLKNMCFSPKKLYLMHLVKKLKRYELAKLNDYDFLITVTQRDLSNFVKLGYNKGGMVLPIGIDTQDYPIIEFSENKELKVSFIGSLDWMPNMEGITWFLEKVWNLRNDEWEGIELHVAGRNTPESLLGQNFEALHVHGEVNDAKEFISSCQVMIVPLFSGSGMRVKILEAMALGRVVITTSLGLEGIHAADGKEVIIANTAQDFQDKILYCKNNLKNIEKIGSAARDLIEKQYDNINNAEKLIASLKGLKSN